MNLTWKSRTFVAAATASLLTAAGVVALANAASGETAAPASTVPAASTPTQTSTDTSALQRSLDDLLGQVSGLEATVAARPVDDKGGQRPADASDDPTQPATGAADVPSALPPAAVSDDSGHYDDDGDDSGSHEAADAQDDHGSDSSGDVADDHGED